MQKETKDTQKLEMKPKGTDMENKDNLREQEIPKVDTDAEIHLNPNVPTEKPEGTPSL